MVERGHQPIVNALAKMINRKWKNWDRYLYAVLWADRTTVRADNNWRLISFPYVIRYASTGNR